MVNSAVMPSRKAKSLLAIPIQRGMCVLSIAFGNIADFALANSPVDNLRAAIADGNAIDLIFSDIADNQQRVFINHHAAAGPATCNDRFSPAGGQECRQTGREFMRSSSTKAALTEATAASFPLRRRHLAFRHMPLLDQFLRCCEFDFAGIALGTGLRQIASRAPTSYGK